MVMRRTASKNRTPRPCRNPTGVPFVNRSIVRKHKVNIEEVGPVWRRGGSGSQKARPWGGDRPRRSILRSRGHPHDHAPDAP